MTVGSYQTSTKTLWFFVIDLPVGDDGKRRQHKRRGFPSKTAAEIAETEARKAYGEAAIGADDSVATELSGWLSERELDIEETTLDNYRNLFRMYASRTSAAGSSTASTSASSRTCTRRS